MEIKIRDTLHRPGKIWYYTKGGTIEYWHREDGPACIMDDGKEEWYYHNKFYGYHEKMPLNLFLAYCKWKYNNG